MLAGTTSIGNVAGVATWPLTMHADERGHLCEVFRYEWQTDVQPLQWIVLRSVAGTVRGMDLHVFHDDFLILLSGRAALTLKDLRHGSPTEGSADLVELSGDEYAGVIIPRGVAHGYYFHETSIMLVGATSYYHPDDHLPCAWDDPELGLTWPEGPRLLSELDRNAPPLSELAALIEPHQPLYGPSTG